MSFTKNAVDTSLVGQTGTGPFVGADSPSLVTPALGVASCTSLTVTGAGTLPTTDGTANQVMATTGSGTWFFTTPSGGTITGGTNLGGGTPTFAGVSGANLEFNTYAAGTNVNFSSSGGKTTISSTGGGITFPYTQAYWVAQTGGSDADLGTSIDTPFLTIQNAITSAGTTPTVIYAVDAFTNTEALVTSGAGQTLYIFAPGTSIATSLTVAANDSVYICCPSLTGLACSGVSYITTNLLFSAVCSAVTCVAEINAQVVNGLSLTTTATVNLSCLTATGITNDATAVLNGTTGGVLPGFTGNQQVSGNVNVHSLSFPDNTLGIVGTVAANNAGAGYVGQYISSTVLFGSAVTLTSGVIANVTSISLTAGDWDVTGNVFFNSSGQSFATCQGWINNVSVTKPDVALTSVFNVGSNTERVAQIGFCAPAQRINVSGTTTIYLIAQAVFSSGTNNVCGTIQARRAR